MSTESADYDAIVIGSGIGGLTVASLLTQVAAKRVLVLEQHFKLGGLTHTFRRKKFEWDVGVHYVGNQAAGVLTNRFMNFVTGGKLSWRKIQAPYDHFVYPQFDFPVPNGINPYRDQLIDRFPTRRKAIHQYFSSLQSASGWMQRAFAAKTMPSFLAKPLLAYRRRLACSSTANVINPIFDDMALRGVVASQWGNYGLPPSQSAFGTHALIVNDYLDGAYYPQGGAGEIAAACVHQIEAFGGKCLVNHKVINLVTDGNQVEYVEWEHKGKTVRAKAPLIISAVGARKTYLQLLQHISNLPERALLESDLPPSTAITLYLGLKADPREYGFHEGNYWIYDDFDHDRIFASRELVVRGHIRQCFLSFGSLRSGTQQAPTAQLISFCDYASWRRWQSQPWMKRDSDYQELKQMISEAMVAFVNRFYPSFRELIDYQELSTPLSVTSMTGHEVGAIYGEPATAARLMKNAFPTRTSFKNLYLTGCDVGSVGINGALMGGVMTTASILGAAGFPRLLAAAKRFERNQTASAKRADV